MLKVFIQGLKDGVYDVDLSAPVSQIPLIFEEYTGNVTFKGKLRILGKRFAVTGTAECDALLLCDLSLMEYTEKIKVDIKASYLADDTLYALKDSIDPDSRENIIREDDKYIDITDDVREELAVSLPMKRVAPEFAGKSFEDIYPEFSAKKENKGKSKGEEVDDRWAPLKNLKMN